MPNYRIAPGLVTEELDREILVCDTDLAVVHRVSGPAADVLRQVIVTDAPVGLADDEVTAGLVAAGVLVPSDAPDREVGRRSFVRAAAAVGTAGVVTLALPRAAAAASEGGEDGGGTPEPGVEGDFAVRLTKFGSTTDVEILWLSTGAQFTYDYTITDSDNNELVSGSTTSGSYRLVLTGTPANRNISIAFSTDNVSDTRSATT